MSAKQRLMSEYKGLEKEKWVNIEVRGILLYLVVIKNADNTLSLMKAVSSNGASALWSSTQTAPSMVPILR
jgi:hypothetical protein